MPDSHDRAVERVGVPACTRRRARLASCRAVSVVRPMIWPMVPNGTAKTSCSTNASRSGGVRLFQHDQQGQADRLGDDGLAFRAVGARFGH
jgi:hypothetical protein